MLMVPLFNYAERNHDAIREMMTHPAGVLGLSDGGAHCTSQDIFVVTGATSGIGKGVVFSLLKYGASVVAVGRNVEKLNFVER